MSGDIPRRCRGPQPDGVWYTIGEYRGELYVVLPPHVPAGSDLETTLVRAARREWRAAQQQHRTGLAAIPVMVGAGLGWLARHLWHPAATVPAAAGVTVVAAAAVTYLATAPEGRRPDVAVPPPSSLVVSPSHRAHPVPHRSPVVVSDPVSSARPSPSPSPSGTEEDGSEGGGVPSAPARTRAPTRVPVPPIPPVTSVPGGGPDCKLVELGVGKLVRICL